MISGSMSHSAEPEDDQNTEASDFNGVGRMIGGLTFSVSWGGAMIIPRSEVTTGVAYPMIHVGRRPRLAVMTSGASEIHHHSRGLPTQALDRRQAGAHVFARATFGNSQGWP